MDAGLVREDGLANDAFVGCHGAPDASGTRRDNAGKVPGLDAGRCDRGAAGRSWLPPAGRCRRVRPSPLTVVLTWVVPAVMRRACRRLQGRNHHVRAFRFRCRLPSHSLRMRRTVAAGSSTPRVSAKRKRRAPAARAASAASTRKSGSRGGILRANRYLAAGVERRVNTTVDLPEHPFARAAQFVMDLNIGHGNGEIDDIRRAAGGGIDAVLGHAAPHHQGSIQAQSRDGLDGLPFRAAHSRNPDLHFRYAGRVE